MDSRLEEFKKKIEFLEVENEKLKAMCEQLKADKQAEIDNINNMMDDFAKWEDLEQLLTQISTCVRFVDKEKAFDEIMKVFSEINQ